jgi:hypothetical protein
LESKNEEALKTYKQAKQAYTAASEEVDRAALAVTEAKKAFETVSAAEESGENRT